MTKTKLALSFCLTTSLVGIMATPALAQNAATPAQRPPAQAESDDPGAIIVTARRVEERLQDVPASITVFNQQQLDQKNVRSVLDLATFTPSLSVDTRFGSKQARFSIRGFSQASRTAATVGVYFADVIAPRGGNNSNPAGDGSGPGSMFDLENIQVLNGPQGTLFGRNTTGGAVIILPKKPSDKWEGYLEGSYGNYDSKRIQGVLNLPLADTVKLRLGVDMLDNNGFLKSISGVGPSSFGDAAYFAARASLLINLSPDLENYTIASYSIAEDHGSIAKVTDCNGTPVAAGKFSFGVQACQQIARGNANGFYTVEGPLSDPWSRSLQWQVTNTTTWNLTEAVTLKNIISYSQTRLNTNIDVLGVNYIIPANTYGNTTSSTLNFGFSSSTRAPGRNNADQQNFVEELRLQGTSLDTRLNWQGGLYYESSTPRKPSGTQAPNTIYCANFDTFQCTDLVGVALTPARASGFLGNQLGAVSFLNRAIYGQATYKLFDDLKLTGGLRYTWDRTYGWGQLSAFAFSSSASGSEGTPLVAPVRRCTLPNVVITTNPTCRTDATQKSQAPTWTVGVDYNPAEDILFYSKYSRGYRQGIVSYNVAPSLQTVNPERVDNYEIGLKMSFHGATPGTFNIAAFYNDLQNQQINVNVASKTGATTSTSANLNAGKSQIWGVEADASARLFEGFTLAGNLAYLRTKVKSLPTRLDIPAVYDSITYAAVAGSVLPFSPKWKWNISGTYQLPLDESVGNVSASATFTRTTSYVYVTGIRGTLDGTGLLSANLNWARVMGSPVDISIYGTNLTGEKYYTGVNDTYTAGGFVSKFVGEPRMYGVRVRYNFGR